MQRALRFLGYRPRSEAELRHFLVQRGYSAAIIERALARLRALHYLDDDTFAHNWARSRAESRGYGPRRIEQELRTKGIGQGLIREVLGKTFAPGDETARAKLILAKRFKNQQLDDEKILRRAAGLLQRHGYSSQVIFDLLKCTIEEDDWT